MLDNKMLVKNNTFITARYNLTLDENRLFVYVLYNIQKNKTELSCTIKRSDFSLIFKNRTNTTVKGITKILDSLQKKTIYFKDKLEDGSIDWGSYVFIMGYVYNNKSDSFKIEVPEKVYNLLMQYIDGYTPITLHLWLGLKNTYAQRFYDLIRMWSGTKCIINYTIDDLKMYLQIEDKYSNFKDFKKRVIIPAITELNQTGYFEIEVKEHKRGRKVHSLDFIVKDLDKRKYFQNNDVTELVPSCYNEFKPRVQTSGQIKMYIPDEGIFTTGTLRSFKIDFVNIDFTNQYMQKAFNEAIMITLDRDNVEKITANSYKFFKSTLGNKIVEYKREEIEDIKHQINLDLFWD